LAEFDFNGQPLETFPVNQGKVGLSMCVTFIQLPGAMSQKQYCKAEFNSLYIYTGKNVNVLPESRYYARNILEWTLKVRKEICTDCLFDTIVSVCCLFSEVFGRDLKLSARYLTLDFGADLAHVRGK
jgi:hypothetical protein